MRTNRPYIAMAFITIILGSSQIRAEDPTGVCCIGEAWGATVAEFSQKHFGQQAFSYSLTATSGNRDLDISLAYAVKRMRDIFNVNPSIVFLDDKDAPNAYDFEDGVTEGSEGTIALGLTLARNMLGRSGVAFASASIATVCAHEIAHLAQYKVLGHDAAFLKGETIKPVELHADFLAGYYAGRRKLERLDYPAAVFAAVVYDMGDFASYDQYHHGTPEERAAAVVAGFNSAFMDKDDFGAAFQKGIEYVRKLPVTPEMSGTLPR
jgi:hypothetical protein